MAKPKESISGLQLRGETFTSVTSSSSDRVLSKPTTPSPQTLAQQPLCDHILQAKMMGSAGPELSKRKP